MKVIFMGTPEIGSYVLQSLLDLKLDVIAVVCQPDRLLNRKKEIVYQPVKQLALDHNIQVFQPEKVKEITEQIRELKPDVIITCAFGQFINKEILEIPTYGCFNVHASLLPKLRGGAPIHWAIINGEKKSGMTLMKMVSKMDAGDIISQMECDIDEFETMRSLYQKLSKLGYEIIQRDFNKLVDKNLVSIPQNEDEVTFGYNITKEQQILNFDLTCQEVDQWIRGLYDKPMAIWQYKDNNIKVHEAFKTTRKSEFEPGTISLIDKTGIYVCTKDFDIRLSVIQLPNKNALSVNQILNGNHIFVEKTR